MVRFAIPTIMDIFCPLSSLGQYLYIKYSQIQEPDLPLNIQPQSDL